MAYADFFPIIIHHTHLGHQKHAPTHGPSLHQQSHSWVLLDSSYRKMVLEEYQLETRCHFCRKKYFKYHGKKCLCTLWITLIFKPMGRVTVIINGNKILSFFKSCTHEIVLLLSLAVIAIIIILVLIIAINIFPTQSTVGVKQKKLHVSSWSP